MAAVTINPHRRTAIVGLAVAAAVALLAAVLVVRARPPLVRAGDFSADGDKPPRRVVVVEHGRYGSNVPGPDHVRARVTGSAGRAVELGKFVTTGFECCWPVGSADVAPDGETVWTHTIDHRMYSIDVSTRNRTRRGAGAYPVVSPDGQSLAYLRASGPETAGRGLTDELVVRDLRSNRTSAVPWRGGAPTWNPAGTAVALLGNDVLHESRVTASGVVEPPKSRCPRPAVTPGRLAWITAPVWHGDRTIAFASATRRGGEFVRVVLAAIHLDTCVETELTALRTPESVADVDVDASGEHFIIATSSRILRWHRTLPQPVEIRLRRVNAGDHASW